jgi:rhodanese-related sulfurtransferase
MKIRIGFNRMLVVVSLLFMFTGFSYAAETNDVLVNGEKQMFTELSSNIPKDKIKTVDDLFKKWEEIQQGKSKAIIIDSRTEAEFDSGHILNSNNVDLGLVYSMPDKVKDVNAEIWVICRTQHRANYFTGLLYKYGFKNVYFVEKGISAWAEKGYPLYNKYMGEIKVTKYQHKLKEDYLFRDNK